MIPDAIYGPAAMAMATHVKATIDANPATIILRLDFVGVLRRAASGMKVSNFNLATTMARFYSSDITMPASGMQRPFVECE